MQAQLAIFGKIGGESAISFATVAEPSQGLLISRLWLRADGASTSCGFEELTYVHYMDRMCRVRRMVRASLAGSAVGIERPDHGSRHTGRCGYKGLLRLANTPLVVN